MKASTFTRFGVLLGALFALAALWGASVASAAIWEYEGERLEHPYSYTAPVERAQFEAVSSTGSREYYLACSMKTAGVVEPGSKGEITSVTDSNGYSKIECSSEGVSGLETCGPPEQVEAVNLPWATELVGNVLEHNVHNVIKAGSKGGKPGWKITCKGGSVETLVENCPFEGYSAFTGNIAPGAVLLYEPAFAQGTPCVSNFYSQGNTLKLSYREITSKYTIA